MPVRSLIEFDVRPGAAHAFATTYLEHGFLKRAQTAAGFISGEFVRTAGPDSQFWSIALWESAKDYDAWQRSYQQVFSASELQALSQYLASQPRGVVTEIVASLPSKEQSKAQSNVRLKEEPKATSKNGGKAT